MPLCLYCLHFSKFALLKYDKLAAEQQFFYAVIDDWLLESIKLYLCDTEENWENNCQASSAVVLSISLSQFMDTKENDIVEKCK